jgi:hypothetical protein
MNPKKEFFVPATMPWMQIYVSRSKLTANAFDLTACNVVTADSAGCLQMTRLCYKSGL